jgi:hypothetical protein
MILKSRICWYECSMTFRKETRYTNFCSATSHQTESQKMDFSSSYGKRHHLVSASLVSRFHLLHKYSSTTYATHMVCLSLSFSLFPLLRRHFFISHLLYSVKPFVSLLFPLLPFIPLYTLAFLFPHQPHPILCHRETEWDHLRSREIIER